MTDMFPRSSHFRLLVGVVLASCLVVGGCDDRSVPEPGIGRTSVERAPASSDPGEATVRIVFLGDSLTAGYGVAEPDAFPALVEQTLRERGQAVEVVNAGVSGDTSAGGRARLDWVLQSRPDVLVVELGANDALRGQPLSHTEQNLRAIIERGRAAGARVVLLGMDVPTSYGSDYTTAFSDLYGRLAADTDVTYVAGFVREVGLDPSLMQPDGLHPTAKGHGALADRLIPTLASVVEEIGGG